MKKTPLMAFVVASSLPVTIWPLLGLAIATKRSGAVFDFSVAAILVPLIFGLYHLVTGLWLTNRKTYLLAGAVLGLMLSSLGTFMLNIPETIYGLTGKRQYLALIGGPVFYGAIWYFVLWPIENRVFPRSDSQSRN